MPATSHLKANQNIDYENFVLYAKSDNHSIPYAIVSETGERHAKCQSIPANLKRILIAIEDRRFLQHRGVDYRGVLRSMLQNAISFQISQGGSTITQQLARNLLRDNRKSIIRKAKETSLALQIERNNTKDQIIELYFNNIYFGKNLRGIRAASLHFFGKEPCAMSSPEMLFMITILRGPNFYLKNDQKLWNRYQSINQILLNRSQISINRFKKNERHAPQPKFHKLEVVKSRSIDQVAESIDINNKTISTSLDYYIQNIVEDFTRTSSCPVSIVAISGGKIIASSSKYGFCHPLHSRTNVGSTLKPFIYWFLRTRGLDSNLKFPSKFNSIGWPVSEASIFTTALNLRDALLLSNNNVFINASEEIGIDSCLEFLASTLAINSEEVFPSTLLGATRSGITLARLCHLYDTFFAIDNLDGIKIECLEILHEIACAKLGVSLDGIFIKTGTTNRGKERLAVIKARQQRDITYAMLINEMDESLLSKEGGAIGIFRKFVRKIYKKSNYQWL